MGGMTPPKHPELRRRRNKALPFTDLPASGRPGKPPPWPLGRATAAQTRLWKSLWATPQAVAWERVSWTRVVARYCLLVLEAEKPDPKPMLMSEVRQLEDRLGLTPKAMRMMGWSIVQDVDDDGDQNPGTVTTIASYKTMLSS